MFCMMGMCGIFADAVTDATQKEWDDWDKQNPNSCGSCNAGNPGAYDPTGGRAPQGSLDGKGPTAASVAGLCKAAGYVSIVPPTPPRLDTGTAAWIIATPVLSGVAWRWARVTALKVLSSASTYVGIAAAPTDLACRLTTARQSK